MIPDGPAYRQRLFVTRTRARHIAALRQHSGSLIDRPRHTLAVSHRQIQLLRLCGLRQSALRIAGFQRDAAGDQMRTGRQDPHTLRRAGLRGAQRGIPGGVEIGAGKEGLRLGKIYPRIARGGRQNAQRTKRLHGAPRVAGLCLRGSQAQPVLEVIGKFGAQRLIRDDSLVPRVRGFEIAAFDGEVLFAP